MVMSAGIGYGISFLSLLGLSADLVSALAAFGVGIFGGIWAHVTKHQVIKKIFFQEKNIIYFFPLQPTTTVLSGILLLVPGSIGVRGVRAFFSQDVISGVQFTFQMMTVGLSIAMGLFVANVVAFPK